MVGLLVYSGYTNYLNQKGTHRRLYIRSYSYIWQIELPLCSDCPSDKRDECNCGVCGSHGGCSFSCDVKSDKSIERGYFKCHQGK